MGTHIRDDILQGDFGDTWEEFLKEGNIEDMYIKSCSSLSKAMMAKSKGKGKGKMKMKPNSNWTIDWEDY